MSRFFLPSDGSWIGPPVLIQRLRLSSGSKVLDGRKRLQELELRGLDIEQAPRQVVTSHLAAMRTLVLNGHAARAAIYASTECPEYLERRRLHDLIGVSHQKLLPFWKALKAPSERHKRPRRAIEVVHRLLSLKTRIEEGERFDPRMIDEVLGPFND